MNTTVKRIVKKLLPSKTLNCVYLYKNKPFPMNWTDEEREKGLIELYKKRTGEDLSFENLQSFREKIQWYKIYYDHPRLSECVCKYRFKQYVNSILGDGFTIPLIGVWTNVDDIPWDNLPNKFVLKSNCQSDGNSIFFVKDKSKENYEKIKNELKKWLKPQNTLLSSYCRAYWNVTPMILAEEYMENVSNQLFDYKIFCFSGKPELIYVATEHFTADDYLNGYPITFYDLNWKKMNIQYGEHPIGDVPVPLHLKQMIEIAKKIECRFSFCKS